MADYELKAGHISEGDTFMKIIDLLKQLQDQYNILGHYKKENGDELIGQGLLGIAQLVRVWEVQTIQMVTGKMTRYK